MESGKNSSYSVDRWSKIVIELSAIAIYNPNGQFIRGEVDGLNLPYSAHAECTDYPYNQSVTIGNDQYKTSNLEDLKQSITEMQPCVGRLLAGMRVACVTLLIGDNHPEWKAINYVERSTDGAWIRTFGKNYDYGFVFHSVPSCFNVLNTISSNDATITAAMLTQWKLKTFPNNVCMCPWY